jgi:kumamolisin
VFVTIHLRDRTEPRRRAGSRSDLAALLVRRDRAELSAQRAAALAEAADQVRQFADAHHSGGYDNADLAAACLAMNVAPPTTVDIAVGNGHNAFGQDTEADKEVALDLQVAIGVAPGARFAVYFTADSDQGLVDAVVIAVHDTINRPTVLVTSWGDAEGNWSGPARRAMDAALADAANVGVTVVAAVGDSLATDGLMDGSAHVDYPASSPYVLACGGTRTTLTADRLGIVQEQVWNDRTSGTGGGISDVYPVPAYQSGLTLPPSVNDGGRRRGVPDLTASAAPEPGYRIVVHGNPVVMGGTSAVAPLCGGFLALINERRRSPLGLVHQRLYRASGLFQPVTVGDNRPFGSDIGYDADAGWSACGGLGVPIGRAIVDSLTREAIA